MRDKEQERGRAKKAARLYAWFLVFCQIEGAFYGTCRDLAGD
jgi:hypothetical protein